MTIFAAVLELPKHLLRRLWQTPLLLGWLVLGLVVALFIDGWTGLVYGLINLVLIGAFAVIICWMTHNVPAPDPIKRPLVETAFALGLLGLFLIIQLLDFDIWTLQPWYGWVKGLFRHIFVDIQSIGGIPDWARQDTYLAVSSTIKQLFPMLLAFWFLGYRRRDMGLVRPYWKLTAVLLGVTTGFGLVTGVLLRAPIGQVLGLYLIGILINALPEELFFRGFLLPRLEKVLANPLNALVVSALLFNALHIPIEISHGTNPWIAMLGMFSTGYPSGLIWGYLYLRTRSIFPGVLWHAANGHLGFILMSQ